MRRLILAMAVALSITGTATAQSKADAQLKRSAEIVFSKYLEAFNSADARALKNLYAQQAITLNRFGLNPSDQTEQQMQRIKAIGIKLQGKVEDVRQIDADTVLSYGSYQASYESPRESSEGTWMQVLKRQGYDWKIRALAMVLMSEPADIASGSSTN
jgi:ketosteroid isomerase-like protein